MKIEWSDEYLLGIPEIDVEHKKLVEIINELYDLINAGEQEYQEKKRMIFGQILDYTLYHFEHEERLMNFFSYDALDMHSEQHRFFVFEVEKIVNNLDASTLEEGARYYSYLLNWVIKHVSKSDKVWAKHVCKVEETI